MRDAVYLRHRAVGNHTRGFWLGSDNVDVVIEDAHVCSNWTDGIFIEASQGPVVLKNSLICDNRTGSGVLTTNSDNVVIEDNILYGNHTSQIRVTGNTDGPVSNRATAGNALLKTERWTIRRNVIVGNRSDQLLLEASGWKYFMDGLNSDKNLWYKPDKGQAFKIGADMMDFGKWQSTTGPHRRLNRNQPLFKDPNNPRSGLLPSGRSRKD